MKITVTSPTHSTPPTTDPKAVMLGEEYWEHGAHYVSRPMGKGYMFVYELGSHPSVYWEECEES